MDHVRQINLANRRNVDFGLRAIIEIAVKKAISSTLQAIVKMAKLASSSWH